MAACLIFCYFGDMHSKYTDFRFINDEKRLSIHLSSEF